MSPSTQPQPPQGSSIVVDGHGAYRWALEFNLWTNPAILFTVLKAFAIAVLIVLVFMLALLIPDLVGDMLYPWQVEGTLRKGGVMLVVMLGLVIVGYVVYTNECPAPPTTVTNGVSKAIRMLCRVDCVRGTDPGVSCSEREGLVMRVDHVAKSMRIRVPTAVFLLAALVFAIAALLLPAKLAHAAEDGYWEYYETVFENKSGEEQLEWYNGIMGDKPNAYSSWQITEGTYMANFTANEAVPVQGEYFAEKGDSVTSNATFGGVMSRYYYGDEVEVRYTMSADYIHRPNAKEHHKTNLCISLITESWISYGRYVKQDNGTKSFSQDSSTHLSNGEGHTAQVGKDPRSTSGTFSAKVSKDGGTTREEMWIYVQFSPGSITGFSPSRAVYRYRWHEGGTAGSTTDVTSSDSSSASSDRGQDYREDRVVNTTASDKDGETISATIPALIVVGAVIIGGVIFLRNRRNRGNGGAIAKDETPDADDDEPSGRVSYQMIVWKNFGNKLRRGGEAVEVGARIQEQRTSAKGEVSVRQRDDLTRAIEILPGQNVELSLASMKGIYKAVSVKVPKDAPTAGSNARAVVQFKYSGEGGTFTNNVSFGIIGNPCIVFLPSDTKGQTTMGMLLDESEGAMLRFMAENFFERPNDVKVTSDDTRFSADVEPYVDPNKPGKFTFKATVRNTIPLQSRLGTWPLERTLTVLAASPQGEQAKGAVEVNLWPEGIYVDTRQIRSDRALSDRIIVDTADILLSAGAEYNIEGAVVEVGAAFRDAEGLVILDVPNHPDDGAYLRLAPVDDFSRNALEPPEEEGGKKAKAKRIWYTLDYKHASTYSGRDERLGTLSLMPLMPLVSKNADAEYAGTIPISYDQGERHYDMDLCFGLKGISSQMNDADLKTERDRIFRLMAAFRPDDWSRIDAALAKYGLAAERERQLLGPADARERAGQSAIELIKSVPQIQSVQRLRAIRKHVYEAADLTVAIDKINANYEAEKFDYLYKGALTVRFFNDIAFSAWWTALCGPGAAAFVEPLMTPLKDWVLGFVEILGLCAFDDEANIPPDDYFTLEGFEKEVLQKQLDGEFMGILMSNTVPTPGSFSWRKLLFAMGATVCYLFYRNCASGKFSKVNEETGTTEFDLWGALKATTADLGIFSIKALLSYFIARKASSKMTEVEQTTIIDPDAVDNPFDKFCAKAVRWLAEDPLKAIGETVETVTTRVGIPGVIEAVPITGNAEVEVVQAAVNGFQSSLIDKVRDVSPSSTSATQTADQWIRGLGVVTVELKDADGHPLMGPDGKPRAFEAPFLTVVALYVDHVLKELGLDIKVDFRGVVPNEPGYTTHDQLVKDLEGIDKANWEVRFLRNPEMTPVPNVTYRVQPGGHSSAMLNTGLDTHHYEI